MFHSQQRTGESRNNSGGDRHGSPPGGSAGSGASDASADSGSGSEGDEVEFVPSSWDCRAAPAKSSLRSLEQATPVCIIFLRLIRVAVGLSSLGSESSVE